MLRGLLEALRRGITAKTRVLRMMDLIQINLKYLYHESFLLADYYIGLRYTLQINGKAYEFTETYRKTGTKRNVVAKEAVILWKLP